MEHLTFLEAPQNIVLAHLFSRIDRPRLQRFMRPRTRELAWPWYVAYRLITHGGHGQLLSLGILFARRRNYAGATSLNTFAHNPVVALRMTYNSKFGYGSMANRQESCLARHNESRFRDPPNANTYLIYGSRSQNLGSKTSTIIQAVLCRTLISSK